MLARFIIFLHSSLTVSAFVGTHDGRPRYIERNKERGAAYAHVIPAEIIYCQDIAAWVFKHDHIQTSLDVDNEVNSYLLFSHLVSFNFQVTDVSDVVSEEPVLVVDEIGNNRFV